MGRFGELDKELAKTAEAAKEKAQQEKEPENQEVKEPEKAKEPEKKEEPSKEKEPEKQDKKLSDNELFGILSGKLGREIKSFDDLVETKEIVKETPRQYRTPETEAYEKYFEETKRPMSDFVKLNKDWSKEPDEGVVISYLRNEFPTLTEQDIRDKIDYQFKPQEQLDPDEYSAEEIARQKRDNRMREIEWKELVAKSRKFHDERKAQFLTPYEQKIKSAREQLEQGREIWREGMQASIPTEMEFGDFKFNVKDAEDYKTSLGSLENFIDRFKKDDGTIDPVKLARTVIAGDKVLTGELLSAYEKHVRAKTIEEQMGKKANRSVPGKEDIEVTTEEEAIKKSEQSFFGALRRHDHRIG